MKELGYENFKRSAGLIYNNYYYDGIKFHEDYEEKLFDFWVNLHRFIPKRLLDQFCEPEEGNPISVVFNGRNVTFDLGMSLYEYWLLSEYIDFSNLKTIHEIGAGYGRTAYVISKLHPEIKYRIFDIEPSLGITKRYLSGLLPSSNLEFDTPENLSGECDLLLGIDCFHEMTKEAVDSYFDYSEKSSKYLYFSAWKETDGPMDGIKWKMGSYPVRESWRGLFSRTHGLRAGFFEALYQLRGNNE